MSEKQRIGRYEVEKLLGEGSMGCVYRAHDPNLERKVAIKTMRTSSPAKADDQQEFKDRFFLEARAVGSLNHPNIVGVYDSGLHDGDPYMVMEYIEGKPLDAFMAEKGARRLEHFLTLIEQIGHGLDYAHEEGVVHRDIKPGNIIVAPTKNGRFRAKIVDFGLAKLKDSKITQTGYFLGTPSYASPEQVLSGKLDTRSDLFSLGIVAYEMLTGKLPFDAESLHAILYRIANEPPQLKLDIFTDHLDVHALGCLFKTIFHKNPDNRYQSAHDFVTDLAVLVRPITKISLQIFADITNSQNSSHASKATSLAKGNDLSGTSLEVQIRELRSLFRQAIESRNLDSSRYCINELKRMGAQFKLEKDQYNDLASQLKSERREQRKLERAKLIKKARAQFDLAMKTGNVQSIRYCISELERLKANVKKEHVRLEEMLAKQAIAKQRQEQQQKVEREAYIAKRREELKAALETRNVDRCGKLMKELGSLLKVDISEERAKLKEVQSLIRHEAEIAQTRSAFNEAAMDSNLKICRGTLARLKDLGADTRDEEQALSMLNREAEAKDAEAFKRRLIERARESFLEAHQRKYIEGCHYYLNELRQLTSTVDEEEQALSSLEKALENQEALRLKSSVIKKMRESFHQAISERNVKNAHYYLREMQQLDAETERELKAIDHLETTIAKEESLARNMVEQVRVRFQASLDEKDISSAQQQLCMLENLKAEVAKEKKALNRLKKDLEVSAEQAKLKKRMVSQFRGKFKEGYRSGNRDTCRYYLKELRQLGADTNLEDHLLEKLESA